MKELAKHMIKLHTALIFLQYRKQNLIVTLNLRFFLSIKRKTVFLIFAIYAKIKDNIKSSEKLIL